MPEWVPWRNLLNLSSSHQTISLLRVLNWMGTLCTSRLHPWNRQSFSDWNDSHAPLGLFAHCRWWMLATENADEELPFQSYVWMVTWQSVQSFAHRIITQSFVNGTFASAFTMMLFFIWEGFARGSPWSMSITAILLIVRGGTRRGGNSFSLCMA